MMKTLKTAATVLFILCLPLLLITVSVSWAVNSQWLYEYGFDKYDISRTTGLSDAALEKAAAGLIHYFNSGEEDISITVEKDGRTIELFNEREVAHLRDVKGLFQLVYRVLLVTLIYALVFLGAAFFWWRDRRALARGLTGGGGLTVLLMLVLGIGVLIDFRWLFLQFHLISFANDFWMLDPSRDYLIMLFPQGFWFDAAVFCVLATVVEALALGGVGTWYLMSRRHKSAGTVD